jgi:hypothetical protein
VILKICTATDSAVIVADGTAVALGTASVTVIVGTLTARPLWSITGTVSTEPLVSANAAETHPDTFGLLGSGICHQSFSAVLPITCAELPFANWPMTDAVVEGAERIRKFSFAVASILAGVGVNWAVGETGIGVGIGVLPEDGGGADVSVAIGGDKVVAVGPGVFVFTLVGTVCPDWEKPGEAQTT